MADSLSRTRTKKQLLSISQMDTIGMCGLKYEFRYLKKVRRAPGTAMLVGRSVDASVNLDYLEKIANGALADEEWVLQAARDELERSWSDGVRFDVDEKSDDPRMVKASAIDKSIRLSKLHHRMIAPRRKPTKIQNRWEIELKGYPVDLVGVTDVEEGAERVIDVKTTSKKPADDVAETSLQLTMYAMAKKVNEGSIPKVALDYLIDTTLQVARSYEAERDDQDFAILLRRVESVVRVLETGAFLPARPGIDWWCAEKWCEFWDCCPMVKHPKQFSA